MYCHFNPDSPAELADILTCNINCQLSIHNWSLKTLSDESDVPYETIKKLAAGKIRNPSLSNITRIAAAFGCTVDYLIGRESEIVNKVRSLPIDIERILTFVVDLETVLFAHPDYKSGNSKAH